MLPADKLDDPCLAECELACRLGVQDYTDRMGISVHEASRDLAIVKTICLRIAEKLT